MKKLKVIVIGAGDRGTTYSRNALNIPEKFEIIAVADPVESRRNSIKEMHNIPDNMCFEDWIPLLDMGKIADAAFICTMDKGHFEPTMKAISLKYDILLEKPISPDPEECTKMAKAAEENNVKVLICHVLRYTDFFKTLKDIIDSGEIGDIITINHEECVGALHQSHSFVRGNWGNSEKSSPMLLQKSCHDMDILQWLIGKKCKKVQSFGSLRYFKESNAPEGAPDYCIQGCPHSESCMYNALKIYADDSKSEDFKKWMRTTATKQANPTIEMVIDAITNTQYGKCVFKCDNDVVDHQTVNLVFEDDVTVTFTMTAFAKGGRFIHIMGTKGEIRAAMDNKTPITIHNFALDTTREIKVTAKDGVLGGHGGGDLGILHDFYDYVADEQKSKSVATITESCNNHMIVFAAEESRRTGNVVDLDKFVNQF